MKPWPCERGLALVPDEVPDVAVELAGEAAFAVAGEGAVDVLAVLAELHAAPGRIPGALEADARRQHARLGALEAEQPHERQRRARSQKAPHRRNHCAAAAIATLSVTMDAAAPSSFTTACAGCAIGSCSSCCAAIAASASVRRAAERGRHADARPLRQGPRRSRHRLRADGDGRLLHKSRAIFFVLRGLGLPWSLVAVFARAAGCGHRLVLRSRGAQSLSHLGQARQCRCSADGARESGATADGRRSSSADCVSTTMRSLPSTSQKPGPTASAPRRPCRCQREHARLERGEERHVARQHAELAAHAGRGHLVDLGGERRALRRDDFERASATLCLAPAARPWRRASSMLPTM